MRDKNVVSCVVRVLVLLLLAVTLRAETSPRKYAVEVSAILEASPPQILLQWPGDAEATGYTVHRKAPDALSWALLGELDGSATQFLDIDIEIGHAYEYQILKTTGIGYPGSGYILAGSEVPPIELRGKLILLVDASHAEPLSMELDRLVRDLVGDGWTVVRDDIPSQSSVAEVRALVQAEYAMDPAGVRAVFILGHVAVPYSGDYDADSHLNHKGAWPGDAPYGDVDGVWSDSTVTSTSSERTWNHNIPGDGKYDQSFLPSDVELAVGRVDFYNLTCFENKTPARGELDLLRQYLEKDHQFRHARWQLPRRGLVGDNFGEASGEALAATAWRSFAPLFGATNDVEVPWGGYFPTLAEEGYLCSYGTGGGGWYTCGGIGSSDDFALYDLKSVFAFFFGSYFGDWDNESNFLRAALGSTSHTLVTGWAGRPHWFLHHMALGATIGHSFRITQNNQVDGLYTPQNHGTRRVHTTLFGDPTLRLHPVPPPAGLAVDEAETGILLQWQQSPDPAVAGYYVYRSDSPLGPLARVSGNEPIAAMSYHDEGGDATFTYMVRALKLEQSASGSYYNLSQGVFGKAISYSVLPAAPESLEAITVTESRIELAWKDASDNEHGFLVQRRPADGNYSVVADLPAGSTSFYDAELSPGTEFSYLVTAYNGVGQSQPSNELIVKTKDLATALFVRTDPSTRGGWKGAYGQEGFQIFNDLANLPDYAAIERIAMQDWVWDWDAADTRALERAEDSSRLAACAYTESGQIQLALDGSEPHRVSFYFLDWDRAGREQIITIQDAETGSLLDTRTLSEFEEGIYLTWDLTGDVVVEFTPLRGNAVVSGIFFDSAIPRTEPPLFDPPPGLYEESVEVTITSATVGSSIHYTMDGSTPNATSPLYDGPIVFTNTTTLKAIATAEGLNPSTVTTAKYTIQAPWVTPSATVQFQGADLETAGNWKGAYGGEGYLTVRDGESMPPYVTVSASRNAEWTWSDATTDFRALERASVAGRMAACWYEREYFEVTFDFHDDELHQVAFYCVDWDLAGRSQKIEIVDSETGQVIHGIDIAGFGAGVYLPYKISGDVVVRFAKLESHNAVLSGIFFDAAEASAAPPEIDPGSGTYQESVRVSISAPSDGSIIHYTLDGSEPNTDSPVYEDSLVLTNSATVKAIVVQESLKPSTVASAIYTIIPPGASPSASVNFLGADTETAGTWKGVYGKDGFMIASDSQALPAYGSVLVSGKSDWIWAYSTTDTRALQRAEVETRMASCWYNADSFEIEIALEPGTPHQVAFYCMDWDRAGREQRVEIIDFATKQVLHSIDLAGFDAGIYLPYTIEGRVVARFTRLQSHNAVVMGIFFDPADD